MNRPHSRPSRQPVILVSDRGPVQFSESPAHEIVSSPRGGSVTSLLLRSSGALGDDVTWLAPSTEMLDARAAALGLCDLGGGLRFVPVVVDAKEWSAYYDDVGVQLIWTVWHGIDHAIAVRVPADATRRRLGGYGFVNHAVADRIAETAPEGATVSVHDYQLMLVPGMLRDRRPDARIGYFNHIPFPSLDSAAAVPVPVLRMLVEGMLGADVIGFQRALWARRFVDCCERLGIEVNHHRGSLVWQGRRLWVRCFPALVDYEALIARMSGPTVRSWGERIRGSDPRSIVARTDRLDPAKNALLGFAAFREVLRREPERAGQVRFVACLVPSRERLPDYHRYMVRTLGIVSEINADYPGTIDVHLGENQDRALGLLSAHDVLLVNPIADGMNLVAQEAAVVNCADGAIVLSAGAGAADLLPDAIPLDEPRSIAATAQAIRAALDLSPAERRARAGRMRQVLAGASTSDWLVHQLADIEIVSEGGAPCCPF